MKDRYQLLYEEALRSLNRFSNMRWQAAIESRVDLGYKSTTCKMCGGQGSTIQKYPLGPTVESDCPNCGREGYVLVLA